MKKMRVKKWLLSASMVTAFAIAGIGVLALNNSVVSAETPTDSWYEDNLVCLEEVVGDISKTFTGKSTCPIRFMGAGGSENDVYTNTDEWYSLRSSANYTQYRKFNYDAVAPNDYTGNIGFEYQQLVGRNNLEGEGYTAGPPPFGVIFGQNDRGVTDRNAIVSFRMKFNENITYTFLPRNASYSENYATTPSTAYNITLTSRSIKFNKYASKNAAGTQATGATTKKAISATMPALTDDANYIFTFGAVDMKENDTVTAVRIYFAIHNQDGTEVWSGYYDDTENPTEAVFYDATAMGYSKVAWTITQGTGYTYSTSIAGVNEPLDFDGADYVIEEECTAATLADVDLETNYEWKDSTMQLISGTNEYDAYYNYYSVKIPCKVTLTAPGCNITYKNADGSVWLEKTETFSNTYTLPAYTEASGAKVIGWKGSDGKLYKENATFDLTGKDNLTFTVELIDITEIEKVSVRTTNDANGAYGIGFTAKVDKEDFAKIKNGTYNWYILYTYQPLIGSNELTKDLASNLIRTVQVTEEECYEEGSYYCVDFNFTNIQTKGLNFKLLARSYVTVTYADGEDAVYGDYNVENCLSVMEALKLYVADTNNPEATRKELQEFYLAKILEFNFDVEQETLTLVTADNDRSGFDADCFNYTTALRTAENSQGVWSVTAEITFDEGKAPQSIDELKAFGITLYGAPVDGVAERICVNTMTVDSYDVATGFAVISFSFAE